MTVLLVGVGAVAYFAVALRALRWTYRMSAERWPELFKIGDDSLGMCVVVAALWPLMWPIAAVEWASERRCNGGRSTLLAEWLRHLAGGGR